MRDNLRGGRGGEGDEGVGGGGDGVARRCLGLCPRRRPLPGQPPPGPGKEECVSQCQDIARVVAVVMVLQYCTVSTVER